jgi:hypothetical protein
MAELSKMVDVPANYSLIRVFREMESHHVEMSKNMMTWLLPAIVRIPVPMKL